MTDAPRPREEDGAYWCSFDKCDLWDGKYCTDTHIKCRECDDPVLCGGIAAHFKEQIKKYQMHLREKVYVDATPDGELPVRILEAYIDDSWMTDNLLGLPPENPLIQEMEKAREERNRILKSAISFLRSVLDFRQG